MAKRRVSGRRTASNQTVNWSALWMIVMFIILLPIYLIKGLLEIAK